MPSEILENIYGLFIKVVRSRCLVAKFVFYAFMDQDEVEIRYFRGTSEEMGGGRGRYGSLWYYRI